MTNKEIGNVLKQARQKAGKSVIQVAEVMGFKFYTTLANYEAGRVNFTIKFINRYCEAIGTPWGLIVENPADPKEQPAWLS